MGILAVKAVNRARGLALAVLALISVVPVAGYAQKSEEGAPDRGALLLREVMLSQHNQERYLHGLPPLVWSEDLALAAERSAQRLATERDPIAVHGKDGDTDGQGENFWVGTRDAYAYDEMAQAWLSERAHYLNGPVPDISRTGDWADVGHYSQIIWSSTRRVGCALVNNAENDLLVCRYDPAGNVLGRTALMDLAAR